MNGMDHWFDIVRDSVDVNCAIGADAISDSSCAALAENAYNLRRHADWYARRCYKAKAKARIDLADRIDALLAQRGAK